MRHPWILTPFILVVALVLLVLHEQWWPAGVVAFMLVNVLWVMVAGLFD